MLFVVETAHRFWRWLFLAAAVSATASFLEVAHIFATLPFSISGEQSFKSIKLLSVIISKRWTVQIKGLWSRKTCISWRSNWWLNSRWRKIPMNERGVGDVDMMMSWEKRISAPNLARCPTRVYFIFYPYLLCNAMQCWFLWALICTTLNTCWV